MGRIQIPMAKRRFLQGKKDGYHTGFQHGFRMGRCQYIQDTTPNVIPRKWDIKVLYVFEGLFNLHQGIVDHLGSLVREMIVADPFEDVLKQAEQEKPDLVFVLNGVHGFPVEQISSIRKLGIRTAVWFADDPYFTDKTVHYAKHYDFVFTHELSCVAFYKEHGCSSVHYLPMAVNPNVFKPKHVSPEYRSDIVFIGSGFPNRIHFFNQITPFLRHRKMMIAGPQWNRLADYNQLRHNIKLEGIQPEETPNYYNGAKIVINMHRDTDKLYNSRRIPALSVNPRTFEIAGCCAFQLTDVRFDLGNFYSSDEVATYSTPEQLLAKIQYYLQHDQEREAMAVRAYQKTLMKHTYVERLSLLLATIFGH